MRKLLTLGVALAAVSAMGIGPAIAFQCPKLATQIETETGNRFDAGAGEARQLAMDAKKLHAEGKHKEAEAKGIEGLAKLGTKVQPTHK